MSGVGIDGEVLSYLELAQVRSNLPFTFSVYSTSSFNADKTFHCCIWTNKDVTNESQKPPAVCNRKDLKVLSFRHCSPCWASFEKNNKGPAPTPAPLCPTPPEAAASHVGEQFRAWEGKALALFWILRHALAEITVSRIPFSPGLPLVSLQLSWFSFFFFYISICYCWYCDSISQHTLPSSSREGQRSVLALSLCNLFKAQS